MAVFTWHRMHKHEDQVEGDILDRCIEEVCDFYKIESRDTNDLTLDQIKDLDKFIKTRTTNRKLILEIFKNKDKVNNSYNIIKENKNVNPSWFGLPILISKHLKRDKIVSNLEKKGVETRPIIS